MSTYNINSAIIIVVVYCVLAVLNVTDVFYDYFYHYLAEIKYHLEVIYHIEMIYHTEIKYHLEMIYDYVINYVISIVYVLVPIYAIVYLRSTTIATTSPSTESEREKQQHQAFQAVLKPSHQLLARHLQVLAINGIQRLKQRTSQRP